MTTTTSYGTWCNRVNQYGVSLEADVADAINGGDQDWRERMESSGALERIAVEYRRAIDLELPPSISLCGDEFIGPAHPEDGEFDGYPQDEYGTLDFKAIVEAANLEELIERYDVDG